MSLNIESNLNSDEADLLRDHLDRANERFVEPMDPKPVGLAVRDQGVVVAGLIGMVTWDWLHINVIWVSDELRGQGYGAELMERAEREARHHGCSFIKLHTFSFQARPFYEKLGYRVIAETPDFPKGHSQFLMFKALT